MAGLVILVHDAIPHHQHFESISVHDFKSECSSDHSEDEYKHHSHLENTPEVYCDHEHHDCLDCKLNIDLTQNPFNLKLDTYYCVKNFNSGFYYLAKLGVLSKAYCNSYTFHRIFYDSSRAPPLLT